MVKTKTFPSFTVVELLISMVVIGILMGLGWRGLAILKREHTLMSSAENMQEALRESRNRAFTSSVVSGSGSGGTIQWVYGYVVRIDSDRYGIYQRVDALGLDELNDATLQTYWEGGAWLNGGELVEENLLTGISVSSDCGQVGFASVNGRMFLPGGGESCTITMSMGGSDRKIELSSLTGEILIQ